MKTILVKLSTFLSCPENMLSISRQNASWLWIFQGYIQYGTMLCDMHLLSINITTKVCVNVSSWTESLWPSITLHLSTVMWVKHTCTHTHRQNLYYSLLIKPKTHRNLLIFLDLKQNMI